MDLSFLHTSNQNSQLECIPEFEVITKTSQNGKDVLIEKVGYSYVINIRRNLLNYCRCSESVWRCSHDPAKSVAVLCINRTSTQRISNNLSTIKSCLIKKTEAVSKKNLQKYAGKNIITLGRTFEWNNISKSHVAGLF